MIRKKIFLIITITSVFVLGGILTLFLLNNKADSPKPTITSVEETKVNTQSPPKEIDIPTENINDNNSSMYYQLADTQMSSKPDKSTPLSKEKINDIIKLISPNKNQHQQPIDTKKYNLVSNTKPIANHTEYEVIIPTTSNAIEHTKGNLGIYGYSYPIRKQYKSIPMPQLKALISKYAKMYNVPYDNATNILLQLNPNGSNEVVELLDGTTQVGTYRINSALQALINAMCKKNINLSNVDDNIIAFMTYYNYLKSNTKLTGSNFNNVLIKTLSYRHNK